MLQNGFLPEFQVASRYVKRYSAEMASQMCWAYAVAKANEISTAFAAGFSVFRFFVCSVFFSFSTIAVQVQHEQLFAELSDRWLSQISESFRP